MKSLELGRRYTIRTCSTRKAKGQSRVKGAEEGYVFVYDGQNGKHYVFHEEGNGLLRTYTLNQLIGRKLEEA